MKVMIEKEAHRKAAQKAVDSWERYTPGVAIGGTEIEIGDFLCIDGDESADAVQLLNDVRSEIYGEGL